MAVTRTAMQLGNVLGNGRRAIRIFGATVRASLPIRRGPKHALLAPVIVSLTSHPPRYPTLHRTLRSLLSQSISPDRVILWIAHEDAASLPTQVKALQRYGLEIRVTDNWRSLTKIGPALLAFPEANIVTADDDLYYPRDWLASMLSKADGSIVARRARTPVWTGTEYAPLMRWPLDGKDGQLSFLTGPGTLFPPHSFHDQVTDFDKFSRLCLTCDDIWLAWHAARAGTPTKRAGPDIEDVAWERTVRTSLMVKNHGANFEGAGHEKMVQNLVDEYGPLHDLKEL